MIDPDVLLLGAAIGGGEAMLRRVPAEVKDAQVQAVLDLLRKGEVEMVRQVLGVTGKSLLDGVLRKSERLLAEKKLFGLRHRLRMLESAPDDEYKVRRIKDIAEEMDKWTRLYEGK